ncbi:MAG: NAD(P)/FAD-dependent oxidoreductase [Ornithinibacter sp.]
MNQTTSFHATTTTATSPASGPTRAASPAVTSPDGPAHDDYDVIVIGARPAGAATAMLLARRGLRVLCVDKAAAGSDILSTHSLVRGGVTQLSRWGLLDRLRDAGTPRARTVEFHYGSGPLPLDVTGPGDVDGLYSPRRTVLDPIIVEAAVEAGAEVHHRVSVTGPVVDDRGAVVGVTIGRGAAARTITARWVVGADGMRSRFADQVGATVLRRESETATVVYAYWAGLPDDVIVNLYDVPGRAIGIVPTNHGEANVWVAMRPEVYEQEVRGDIRGAYDRLLAQHTSARERLTGATCVGGHRSFPGRPGHLRQAHGNGWALVGDAGYFKDPVSAHGITDAFICAELLSDALADVLLGGADPAEALEGYQSRRDEMASLLITPTTRIASLRDDGAGMMRSFQELGIALRDEVEMLGSRALVGA